MTPQELEAEALKLDGATRAKLAARLWESLDDPSEEEWNELGVQKPRAEMRRSTPIRLGGFLPGKSSSACVRSISEPQRHFDLEAETEYEEAIACYRDRSALAADRFVTAVETVFHPLLGDSCRGSNAEGGVKETSLRDRSRQPGSM